MQGSLYVIATPIGNLEDITLRALRLLGEVDLIACEDTRHTRKLLAHYQISKPTLSYHAHNERERAPELIAKLKSGLSIALVSDAGTPLVSDPGYALVQEAIAQSIQVVPVPGASAFVAPHRIKETLADARQVLGNRQCAVARELTKLHEEFLRGALDEVCEALQHRDVRGEIVLLVGPPSEDAAEAVDQASLGSIAEQVAVLMRDEKLGQKAALKRVARARRLSKSEAYRRLIAERAAEEIATDDVE
jgi:16S rRNA (cytidine1402-2'-O)-methyltransferase